MYALCNIENQGMGLGTRLHIYRFCQGDIHVSQSSQLAGYVRFPTESSVTEKVLYMYTCVCTCIYLC